MAYRYIGKWGGSPNGDSPTLWVNEETGHYYLQGYTEADPAVIADLLAAAGRDHLPSHESIISFPPDMVFLFPEVNDDRDGSDL